MASNVCSILLAFIAGPIPNAPTVKPNQAWLTGMVSDNNIRPLEAELLHDRNNLSYVPKEFRDGTARMFGGHTDCTDPMVSAGLKMGPWPESSVQNGMPVSPDGQPVIEFNPVRLSKNGKYVLVSWFSTYGPLAASFEFAILERKKAGWETIRLGEFGPIS